MDIRSFLTTKWKWWVLATAGLLAVANTLFFKLHIDRIGVIPVNGYFATLPEAVIQSYGKYNFGGDGFWLQTPSAGAIPLSGETDGFLWGLRGERIAVSITPKTGIFFVKLPTRPAESGTGVALDLPVGLHHFTHLSVTVPEEETKEYPIGNIWLEVLPQEQTDSKVPLHEYHARVYKRMGYNPVVLVRFQNRSHEPVVFTGIHLPQNFPYGIDWENFRVESGGPEGQSREGVAMQLDPPEPPLPMTKKVLPTAGSDFPEPVAVEPGKTVSICFALAARTRAAFGAFVAINPVVLRTADGRYIAAFSPPLARGLP
ncbi:MAG: hypothetical protein QHH27_06980 [Clostridia bacterium]|nr:hypothetical protein [Clostridia bacterium]MDH7573272.1 hypothetical protein [Clostridia bacterium]